MQHILKQRWLGLCDQLNILSGEQSWAVLTAHYQAEGRHYHTLGHVGHCLGSLDKHRQLANQPLLVEYALWMHDIVYNSHRNDNEALSAQMAALWLDHDLRAAGEVEALIMVTAHHSAPQTQDQLLMVDIDLGILGASRSSYAAYAAKVRREYAWVPDMAFQVGRGRVLRDFLSRPSIYHLPLFALEWEAQARENLQWELDTLGKSADSADQREKGCS